MVIMYHHVHDQSHCLSRLGHMPVIDFKKQVEYMSSKYECSYDKKGGVVSPSKVTFTFDDGLKSHTEFVAPCLEKMELRGVFYISSMPLLEGKVCNVHLCHYLLAYYDVVEVWNFLKDHFTELNSNFKISSSYFDQSHDDVFKQIKTLFNYELNPTESRALLLFLLKRDPAFSEKWLLENLYANLNEIRSLINRGHLVAPHFHTHTLLSRLDRNQLNIEFDLSIGLIADLTGLVVEEVCVPFGGERSWNALCQSIAKSRNINTVVLVKPIEFVCNLTQRLMEYTPRVDCSELPFSSYVCK